MSNEKGLVLIFLIAVFASQSVSAADYAYLIKVTGTSFLPSTIYAGDTASIRVNVENKAASISVKDLNASLDLGSQFEAVEPVVKTKSIEPGQTKTLIFKFRVKADTIPGYYPAFLSLKYMRGSSKAEQTESFSVPVSKAEKNIDVTVEPRTINPGNQSELVFSLKNIGKTPVSNLSFSWTEGNDLILPVGSDNKRYIQSLSPGETNKITYIVAADPNITTGIYPLSLEMTFTDVNGIKTQQSQVGLIVGGGTDFEVSAELSSGQLSLSLANIGSNNAEAVVVRIPNQPGITVSGSNISILGNLNKGDFTIANFEAALEKTSIAKTATVTGSETKTQNFNHRTGERKAGQRPAPDWNTLRDQAGKLPAVDRNKFKGQAENPMLFIEISYTDTTGERQTSRKAIFLNQKTKALGTALFDKSRTQKGNSPDFLWMALSIVLGIGLVATALKLDNENWMKMLGVTMAIFALFLGVVYFMHSDQAMAWVASAISLGLIALYLKKLRS